MTHISIAGECFNILLEGDKTQAVLMLSNPLGTSLRFWDPQTPALLQHFRVLRYDSRGHGESIISPDPISIGTLGRDAVAILDALGIEKVHWLGLSLGGIIGQWLLIHASERIGRAVLANTAAHIPGPDLWNSRISLARRIGMDGIAEAAADRWFTGTFRKTNPEKVEAVLKMVRATPLQGYVASCAAIRDTDLRQDIRAIRTIENEVLVIAGSRDISTPPALGASVAGSIEGAQFLTLDAPHLSSIEDEAHFTQAVINFLTAPAAATR